MAILGNAAVAMWWNIGADHRAEFQEWHSKEHFLERLSIPGFRRGSRWQAEGSGDFFVMYELSDYDVLTSDGYLVRLNAPTPWSTKMMPLHSGMVRSQCRVLASNGGGVATFMTTLRLSPEDGRAEELERHLRSALAALLSVETVTGAHLLRTETPTAAQTTEQKIRGGDAVADWIALVSGHDAAALGRVCADVLGEQALRSHGAAEAPVAQVFRLVHAVTSQDV